MVGEDGGSTHLLIFTHRREKRGSPPKLTYNSLGGVFESKLNYELILKWSLKCTLFYALKACRVKLYKLYKCVEYGSGEDSKDAQISTHD